MSPSDSSQVPTLHVISVFSSPFNSSVFNGIVRSSSSNTHVRSSSRSPSNQMPPSQLQSNQYSVRQISSQISFPSSSTEIVPSSSIRFCCAISVTPVSQLPMRFRTGIAPSLSCSCHAFVSYSMKYCSSPVTSSRSSFSTSARYTFGLNAFRSSVWPIWTLYRVPSSFRSCPGSR